jgi:hypothetical protein
VRKISDFGARPIPPVRTGAGCVPNKAFAPCAVHERMKNIIPTVSQRSRATGLSSNAIFGAVILIFFFHYFVVSNYYPTFAPLFEINLHRRDVPKT